MPLRRTSISAWAVASPRSSRRLWSAATTDPSGPTMTAPTGTSPCSSAALRLGQCLPHRFDPGVVIHQFLRSSTLRDPRRDRIVWPSAHAWKACRRGDSPRGFESHSLRRSVPRLSPTGVSPQCSSPVRSRTLLPGAGCFCSPRAVWVSVVGGTELDAACGAPGQVRIPLPPPQCSSPVRSRTLAAWGGLSCFPRAVWVSSCGWPSWVAVCRARGRFESHSLRRTAPGLSPLGLRRSFRVLFGLENCYL